MKYRPQRPNQLPAANFTYGQDLKTKTWWVQPEVMRMVHVGKFPHMCQSEDEAKAMCEDLNKGWNRYA